MKNELKKWTLEIFGPILGFSTKEGFKIRDPRISWYSVGTKNHEMRGPPVLTKVQIQDFKKYLTLILPLDTAFSFFVGSEPALLLFFLLLLS